MNRPIILNNHSLVIDVFDCILLILKDVRNLIDEMMEN